MKSERRLMVELESQPSSGRPLVISYDSGYEHSLEHWLDMQQLVEADDAEPIQGSAGRL
jgi:hypothetical protein